jgi:hypothetical protein
MNNPREITRFGKNSGAKYPRIHEDIHISLMRKTIPKTCSIKRIFAFLCSSQSFSV